MLLEFGRGLQERRAFSSENRFPLFGTRTRRGRRVETVHARRASRRARDVASASGRQFGRQGGDEIRGRQGPREGRALPRPLRAETALPLGAAGRGEGFAGVVGDRIVRNLARPFSSACLEVGEAVATGTARDDRR